MPIFENPLVIIGIFIFLFLALISLGIYFALKGAKTAGGHAENDFSSISKIEGEFKKAGKQRANRCVLFVNVSSSSPHNSQTEQSVFAQIKHALLTAFAHRNSYIAPYDDNSYIVISNLDNVSMEQSMEDLQAEINSILLNFSALNLVSVKIGAHFASGTHVIFDEAISRAKQACVVAKNENLFYAQWDISSGIALEKKIKIENNIEKEIDNNRFFLEYQPVLDAKTKTIIGAEVLSRLNSESDGVLTPHSFLSAVSSVGVSEKFDYYIFEKNCKWISNDKNNREGYKYTVNFSRSTLSEPEFAKKIITIAEKYDLKLSCLAVEVLEDKTVTDEAKKQMIDNLAVLKEKGISVLLDDFGSGYTTFGDLQSFDVSIVKIDKAITQNAVTKTGFIILKNIIQTSHDIGFKTLCEGIETKEQEEAAINAGCDMLQGFYYYRPMPVSKLEKLLKKDLGGV